MPIPDIYTAVEPATQQQQQSSFTERKTALQPNPRLLALAPLNPPSYEDYNYTNNNTSSTAPTHPPHTSYLYRRSAPTTPSILSSSPPPFARGVSAPYSLEQAARTKIKRPSTTRRRNSNGTKTKRPNHRRSKTTENSPTTPRPFQSPSSFFPDTDFLLRVGALIASEAREAKGQGWLATRDSSAASTPAVADYDRTYPTYRPDEETLAARRRIEEQQRLRAARRSLQASRRGSRDFGRLNGITSTNGHAHGLSEELTMSLAGLTLTNTSIARSASQATFPGRWPGSGRTSRPMTPMEERRAELLVLAEDDPAVREDYFNSRAIAAANAANAAAAAAAAAHEDSLRPQPDFIGLNERLEFPERFAPARNVEEEEEEEDSDAEEEYLRAYIQDKGVLGRLFDYIIGREDDDDDDAYADDEEDYEEDEEDDTQHDADDEADQTTREAPDGGDNEGWYDVSAEAEAERQRQMRRSASWRRLQECTVIPLDTTNDPPPREGGKGGVVSDAVWLVRVAARAMFW